MAKTIYYTTVADFKAAFVETKYTNLINVDDPAGAVIANDFIYRAEGIVNGYLAIRYTIPVTANALCEQLTIAIAMYQMFKRGQGDAVPIKYREAYTDALEMLTNISTGVIDLPGVSDKNVTSGALAIDITTDDPLMRGEDVDIYF